LPRLRKRYMYVGLHEGVKRNENIQAKYIQVETKQSTIKASHPTILPRSTTDRMYPTTPA
jgi:hypothetical protein